MNQPMRHTPQCTRSNGSNDVDESPLQRNQSAFQNSNGFPMPHDNLLDFNPLLSEMKDEFAQLSNL